jgi:hypothetical protein
MKHPVDKACREGVIDAEAVADLHGGGFGGHHVKHGFLLLVVR